MGSLCHMAYMVANRNRDKSAVSPKAFKVVIVIPPLHGDTTTIDRFVCRHTLANGPVPGSDTGHAG